MKVQNGWRGFFSRRPNQFCYNPFMKIAILGGSFDPPHIGHYLVAQQVRELLLFDKVLLIPCFRHPFNKPVSNNQQRLAMTQMLETKQIRVSDVEIQQKTTSYSINTLHTLKKENSHDDFFWIIGSDQIATFSKWKNWEKIIETFGLIIFPRDAHINPIEGEIATTIGKQFLKNIHIINSKDAIITNISSSKIRTRIKNGLPITHLVPPKVEKYILDNGLYR